MTADAAPTTTSITPASGTIASAVQRVFAAVYSDGNSYADIKHVFLLVNSAVSGSGACYVHYNEDTNRLAVRSGSTWKFTSTGPGSGSPVSSAQCSLDPAVSSVTRTGDNLTVNYAVTFTDAMAGSQNLYLYAKDGGNLTSGWSDHGNLSVTAAEPASASVLSTIEIDTTGVPSAGVVDTTYDALLQADGGTVPYTWSLTESSDQLPPDLNLDPATGQITGVPTAAGIYAIVISVTDSTGAQAEASIDLIIEPSPLLIATDSSMTAGVAGADYSAVLEATGGVPPYSWALFGGIGRITNRPECRSPPPAKSPACPQRRGRITSQSK